MTKQEIITQVSQVTGQTKSATEEAINTAIIIIQNAVASGNTVSIQGFISLTPVTRKAIEGDLNGVKYSKPERQGVKLKMMGKFKELVEYGAKDVQGVQDEK